MVGRVRGGTATGGVANRIMHIANAAILTTNWFGDASNNEYLGNDISDAVSANDCHTAADGCRITGGWESAINNYDGGSSAAGHNLYRGNLIHDNDGEGQTFADYDTAIGNTYHDNFSVDVYLDGTQYATIERNLIYESETAPVVGGPSAYRLRAIGIALADEGAARNCDNAVRNNVILNTSIGINYWHANAGSGLIRDTFDNNTIVNSWTCGLCFDGGSHSATLVRNNLVVPRQGTVSAGVAASGVSAVANLFAARGASNDPELAGEGTFRFEPDDYALGSAAATRWVRHRSVRTLTNA
jgi:Right handed beta helix region